MLLLGDSFTESVQFEPEESSAGLLAARLGQRTLANVGLGGGARIVHLFRLLEKFSPDLVPDLVAVQIPHNDFYDPCLGIADLQDLFSHRLSHMMPTSMLEHLLSMSHTGTLFNGLIFRKRKTMLSVEEKLDILRRSLHSEAPWVAVAVKYCMKMAQAMPRSRVLFYLPPSPFALDAPPGDKATVSQDLGLSDPAAYDVFSLFHSRLEGALGSLPGAAAPHSFEPKLSRLSPRERAALFIDRSHLSAAGHVWFAECLHE